MSLPPKWPLTKCDVQAYSSPAGDVQPEELRWNTYCGQRGAPCDRNLYDVDVHLRSYAVKMEEGYAREKKGDSAARTGLRVAIASNPSDCGVNSKLEELNPAERQAFQAEAFLRFQVPTRPPPKDYC